MKPIPAHLLAEYMARRLPSHELARIIGVHPVTVRRNIKRPPYEAHPNKTALIQAREAYRATVAHLPVSELQTLLHVSRPTAQRIRRKYRGA